MTASLPRLANKGRVYSTDVEGGTPVVVRMRVAGRLGASYTDFIASRARWLSLSGWVTSPHPGRAEVVAAGPEALVSALEMAVMLGPPDALVETLETEPAAGPIPPRFAVLG